MRSGQFTLNIASVQFNVQAAPGLLVVEDDPLYSPFCNAAKPLNYKIEISVSVNIEPMPSTEGLEILFDSETAWIAFKAGNETRICQRDMRGKAQYLWMARFKDDCRQVTVHCAENLAVTRGDGTVEIQNMVHYPLDQLLLGHVLAPHHGFVVHAAGIARHGKGLALAGRSGAGKTTLMEGIGGIEQFERLSDDRLVVQQVDDRFQLFGTPWAGEGRVASNYQTELAAIAFLTQAPENRLRRLAVRESLPRLLEIASILWFDRERASAALGFCEALLHQVPLYELSFTRGADVAEALNEIL